MFNLEIPPTISLLGIDSSGLCTTPKTPEIVNSLIAMTTNPLDNYNFNNMSSNASSTQGHNGVTAVAHNGSHPQLLSQDSNHSSSSATPLDSPSGNHMTLSVQQTCSQLIKAGLKLSIQSKRKISSCDSSSGSEQTNSKCSRRDEDCDDTTDDDSEHKSMPKGLTPEDEDRRRRRRERNKIAATKCRMKKRERTQNLIKESEQLDTQNVDLKNQVRALESERRKLLEMLQSHANQCEQPNGFHLPEKLLTSPAYKYLADLDMDNNNLGSQQLEQIQLGINLEQQVPSPPRTVIPPMSTIFSRSNNFKNAVSAIVQNSPMQHPTHQVVGNHTLPNGYCKPSPTPQELGYLSSPSQESMCLVPALQRHSPTSSHHQLTDYIPNCNAGDNNNTLNSLPVVTLDTHSHSVTTTPTHATIGDSSVMLSSSIPPSPLSCVLHATTPTTAVTEFVKNELVESQSPYTTAASAERFLFENSFIDIKHAISVHPHNNSHNNNNNNNNHHHHQHHHHINHNNNNSLNCNNNNNNNNSLLDFTSNNGIVSFHEQISMKGDYLQDADILAQLTGDAAEFVDLDTGISASFSMANGGCLA